MGKRRDQRVRIELPVRVFGTDADGRVFTRLAHTVDVSYSGARISGIYVRLNAGDVLGIQHAAEKGRFRVAWVGERGSARAGEAGFRAVDPAEGFWGMKLERGGWDDYEPQNKVVERRRHPRFHCDIGVKVRTPEDVHAMYARCTDISIGGCYLETWSPAALGGSLDLEFTLPSGAMNASAVVRTVHPAFGMGVQFSAVQEPLLLKKFIDQVSHAARDEDATKLITAVQSGAVAVTRPECSIPVETGLRARVLVAEDSRFLQNAYAYYLRRDGYDVLLAHDGEQALTMASSERPDLIVLDLLMPKMGGLDALKLLKSDPATSCIPVIVLSGLSHSNETKLIAEGALTYLEKSEVGPDRLAEAVSRSLQRSGRESMGHHKWSAASEHPLGMPANAR